MGLREPLLFDCDVAQAPPSVVVHLVNLECHLVAPHATLIVFVGDELVTLQRVGVCEILLQLESPLEEFQCIFMVFLQTVIVSNHDPCLRCILRHL